MEQVLKSYYLYCNNLQCKVSIYHQITEVPIPFTIENLMATHTCPRCGKPLISAIDIAKQRRKLIKQEILKR